tara:strand:+ start:8210 stop:9925 length:1716 start_codon:yes stop_codon:yes gene_type:complete
MIVNAIITFFFINVIGLCFVLSGQYIIQKTIRETNKLSNQLFVSLSYFTGAILFLFVFRLSSFIISNAYISIAFAFFTILMLSLIILTSKNINFLKIFFFQSLSNQFFYFALLISVSICLLFYWTDPSLLTDNVLALLGSLHSPRYVNIANYIVDANIIPVINQNYGQSLLTASTLFLGLNAPYFTLFLWLAQSIFFLIFITFGLFKWLGLDFKSSSLGTIIVLLGNTTFSLSRILVIDSGSPFFLNGYTDSVLSIGTFIAFFLWFYNAYIEKYNINRIPSLFLLIIFGITWNIFAPQNIIFSIGILAFFTLKILIFDSRRKSFIMLSTIVFLLASLFGTFMGGMLTPTKLTESVEIEGLMQVKKNEKLEIGIVPQLPYFFSNGTGWSRAEPYLYERDKKYRDQYNSNSQSTLDKTILFFKMWIIFETNIWIAFRIMIIPFIGVLGLWMLIFYKSKWDPPKFKKYKMFVLVNTLIIIPGFIIPFLFTLSGYKWELTRFLIPGIYMAMMSFVIFLKYFHFTKNIFIKKYFSYVVAFLLISPIIIDTIIRIGMNVKDFNKFLNFCEFILGKVY